MEKKVVYHEELANNYNEYHSQEQRLFNLQIEKIYSYLNLSNLSSVIDAGCGAGRLLIPMSDFVSQITGVELSLGMFKTAMQDVKNRTRTVSNSILEITLQNESWQEFLQKNIIKGTKVDGIYFSMSLHQMGSKEEQHNIITQSLELLKDNGKLLLITVSDKQFDKNLLNLNFPSLDKIDRERFIDVEELIKRHNVTSVEEHTVYKKYDKETYIKMLENKYISSLQLISEEFLKEGINKIKETYKDTDTVIVPDFYTYVVIEK